MLFEVFAYRDVHERAIVEIEAATKDEAENIFYNNYSEGDYEDDFEWRDEDIDVTARPKEG